MVDFSQARDIHDVADIYEEHYRDQDVKVTIEQYSTGNMAIRLDGVAALSDPSGIPEDWRIAFVTHSERRPYSAQVVVKPNP